MRATTQTSTIINLIKVILICCLSLFLLFMILSHISNTTPQPSNSSSSSSSLEQPEHIKQQDCTTTCKCNSYKTPHSLAHALVHYATLNITPQQTLEEISVTLKLLQEKSPCNLLVFGLGHDSLMWKSLNHGGRTVFLEEDTSWINQVKAQIPSLEAYHVAYNTKLTQADELLELGTKQDRCWVVVDPRFSTCQLALKSLPREVYDVEWDMVMVDAPTGYHDEAPGRMSVIYTMGLMARSRKSGGETDVLVHDVDRLVEDRFSKAFLCEGYLREQQGKLRHFAVPSHRTRLGGGPLCP